MKCTQIEIIKHEMLCDKNYQYYLEQNITCIKYYQSSFKTSDYPKENIAYKKSVQIRHIKKVYLRN